MVLVIAARRKKVSEPKKPLPWFPPETYQEQVFTYQKIFGGEQSEESEKAWLDLIPSKSNISTKRFLWNALTLSLDRRQRICNYT